MDEVIERFQGLDSLEMPDVWTEALSREPSPPSRPPTGRRLAIAAFAFGLATLAIGFAFTALREAPPEAGIGNPPAGQVPGRLVFTGSRGGDPVIYSVNTDGKGLVPIETRLTSHAEPAWSPDGTQIAFAGAPEGGGDYPDIYVMDADGTNLRQLTSEPRVEEGSPAWSPDGTMIVFSRLLNRGSRLFVVDVGSGDVRQLTDDATYMDSDPDWSPDGTQIVFMRNADSFPSIYAIDADGTNLRRLTTEHGDTSPAWSPDGGQIAFVRDEQQEGEYHLYVMDADGANLSRLAAGSGFESRPFVRPEPAWSPDGAELVFFRATSLMAIRPDGSGETTLLTVSRSVARHYLGDGGVDWAAI